VRAVPPDPETRCVAEIEWRETDGEPRFAVSCQALGAADRMTVIESPALEWPPTGPASVQALIQSVDELATSLAIAGWKPLPPGGAWYAKRFTWEPAPAERGLFARTPAWPQQTHELWRCELDWDAGWVDSRFRAVVRRPGSKRGHAIGASAAIKWMLMSQPDRRAPEHREAVHSLATSLVVAGWEPVGHGANWYSQRFVWRRDEAPRDHLEPCTPPESCRERRNSRVLNGDEADDR
jgi:hypothetical protein